MQQLFLWRDNIEEILIWGKKNNYPAFSFPFSYPPRNEDADRRFGLLFDGEQAWTSCIRSKSDEWLIKCIEHLERFERGVHSMPWKEFPFSSDCEDEE